MWVAGSLFIINDGGDEEPYRTDRQPAAVDLTYVIVDAQIDPTPKKWTRNEHVR